MLWTYGCRKRYPKPIRIQINPSTDCSVKWIQSTSEPHQKSGRKGIISRPARLDRWSRCHQRGSVWTIRRRVVNMPMKDLRGSAGHRTTEAVETLAVSAARSSAAINGGPGKLLRQIPDQNVNSSKFGSSVMGSKNAKTGVRPGHSARLSRSTWIPNSVDAGSNDARVCQHENQRSNITVFHHHVKDCHFFWQVHTVGHTVLPSSYRSFRVMSLTPLKKRKKQTGSYSSLCRLSTHT